MTPVEPEIANPQAEFFISGLVEERVPPPPVSPAPEESPEPQATERHLRVVPPRSRRRPVRRLVLSLVAAGIVVVSFGLVGLHVVIAEAQFRLDNLEQRDSTAQAKYEKLRLSVAELQAPGRIVSMAEALGMQQPGSETFLPAPDIRGAASTNTGTRGDNTGGAGGTDGPSRGGRGEASASGAPNVVQAPGGDADWPSIKPYLSGSP